MDPRDTLDRAVAAEQQALLTVKEYAAYLRVHPETVKRWIYAGKLKAHRTRGKTGHWRIRAA